MRQLSLFLFFVTFAGVSDISSAQTQIGSEKSVTRHLADGEEYSLSTRSLISHGELIFKANWTSQEGGGRPLTKGTGSRLSDLNDPLIFPRNMNRVSAPDANSCAGCHNLPFVGGGGDFVANVFVLGQRFDFATFDPLDLTPTKGAMDENGQAVSLQQIGNSRNTLGMFGAGYIEMLARQLTKRLQALRASLAPGTSAPLLANGIDFGTLARQPDGTWDTSGVVGLPPPSLQTAGADSPPTLVIRPFHQAGAVISLRQFTTNAMNHHHGIQATERFGVGTDADGDGFTNEITRADTTAVTLFQATLPVPGRVIPRDKEIEQAVRLGENQFLQVGCGSCHVPSLPLENSGWIFSEPNPFNPAGNLQPDDVAQPLFVNLNDKRLPRPRLKERDGITCVPAFTDLKLHDITSGLSDPNREPLNMQFASGSNGFNGGNSQFITRKLWGVANEPPFFHHGQYTTLRQAVESHAGEAAAAITAYHALTAAEQDGIIEFLKTLQVLDKDTRALVVDEYGRKRTWRAFPYDCWEHLGSDNGPRA